MIRIFKFISAFLGVALLVFLMIYGFNQTSFDTLLENREGFAEGSEWVEKTYSLRGLTDYIAEHPDRVSIASIIVEEPDSSLFFEEEIPRAMGTIANFFLLIGYADAFETGELNPDERIQWDSITRYQIPQVGESVHREAYRYGQRNGLLDDQDSITVKNALKLLTRHHSLALSDFLLFHLGEERIRDLYHRLELQKTEQPLPFSGILTTLSPVIQGLQVDSLLQRWSENPRDQFEQSALDNSKRFSNGSERQEWMEAFNSQRLGLNFMRERDLLDYFPKTTANEMVQLLLKLNNRELISEEVSDYVHHLIQYPQEESSISRNFSSYAALYDNRVGLLNGIDIGTSVYTGNTTVQAVFFDQMQIAVWFHMSSNHMHQDFQQRLIWDPALIERMNQVVNRVTREHS